MQQKVLTDEDREIDQQFLVASVVVEEHNNKYHDAYRHDGRKNDCNNDGCIHEDNLLFDDLQFTICGAKVRRVAKYLVSIPQNFVNGMSGFRKKRRNPRIHRRFLRYSERIVYFENLGDKLR